MYIQFTVALLIFFSATAGAPVISSEFQIAILLEFWLETASFIEHFRFEREACGQQPAPFPAVLADCRHGTHPVLLPPDEKYLFPQLVHFPENFAGLFITQQNRRIGRVAVRAEELPLDHAEQAANSGAHFIDGTFFGFGVEQGAGVYPLL